PVCLFESEEEVTSFQREAGWRAEDLSGATVELQPAAMGALLRAREDVRAYGLDITPRGGSEAGRRSFADSLRLWRSRFEPALAHHGWFQTVLSDLPHFTYLGLDERHLPARGLRRVEAGGQSFWIPNIVNREP